MPVRLISTLSHARSALHVRPAAIVAYCLFVLPAGTPRMWWLRSKGRQGGCSRCCALAAAGAVEALRWVQAPEFRGCHIAGPVVVAEAVLARQRLCLRWEEEYGPACSQTARQSDSSDDTCIAFASLSFVQVAHQLEYRQGQLWNVWNKCCGAWRLPNGMSRGAHHAGSYCSLCSIHSSQQCSSRAMRGMHTLGMLHAAHGTHEFTKSCI